MVQFVLPIILGVSLGYLIPTLSSKGFAFRFSLDTLFFAGAFGFTGGLNFFLWPLICTTLCVWIGYQLHLGKSK